MESIAYITSRKKQYDLKDIEARRTKLDKKDLPKNVSDFLNDKGYVDKTVSDLINYYTKSETYSKDEVQELISTRVLIKIVDELPESNISTSTIYFLKRPSEDLPQSQYQSDVYDEYIYVDATWELIGNTYVDLTPYYTKEEVEIVIDNKILEERLIRENAELTLQDNIDALEQKTDSEITQIKQINLNQDNSISNLEINLENEITRATNKENELSDRSDNFDSHIEDNGNPHNVTKSQIGLDNVENLPMDDTPTLNSENYVESGGVFNALEKKIDKVEGKGLSDENFTYEEKIKLSNLKNYDDSEINNKVNQNTSDISILNSDSTVEGSVDNKIKNALLDVSGLQFNVVEELPTAGENGVIYFVLNTSISEGKNYYDEYIWINNKFELLGQTVTEIDLSNYHTKAEINALLSGKASIDDDVTTTDKTWSSDKIGKEIEARKITVDDNINSTSTNPVQNKVIDKRLDYMNVQTRKKEIIIQRLWEGDNFLDQKIHFIPSIVKFNCMFSTYDNEDDIFDSSVVYGDYIISNLERALSFGDKQSRVLKITVYDLGTKKNTINGVYNISLNTFMGSPIKTLYVSSVLFKINKTTLNLGDSTAEVYALYGGDNLCWYDYEHNEFYVNIGSTYSSNVILIMLEEV